MTIEDQGGALGASSGCPTCGTQVNPGARYCQGCGSPVAGDDRASVSPAQPPAGAGNPGPGYPPPYQGPYQAPYQPPSQGPYPGPYQAPYQGPYQPPYPGYYSPVPVGQRTNGMAIASLVLGIVWLWWIGSILALVFGYIALGQIKQRHESGRGMAIAGVVLGWVGIVTGVFFGVLLAVAARHVNTTSFGP
jgi:hypothetical protein